MLWHKGDVYDAVNKVKESQKYLFVFIRDENTSQDCIEIIEKSSKLQDILFNSICLNLMKDTDEYRKFSEVYRVEEIPSIHIITYQGELIDIIKNIENEEDLCVKLTTIYGIKSEVEENSSESHVLADSSGLVDEVEDTESKEAKMIEVRRILAEKHRQKAEEDRQKEKEDELKRRELGKQLHQLKQTQKEKEEEDIKAQIKKQRNEEKEARDKILRQIEDDKMERKQKFSNQQFTKPNEEKTELKHRNIDNGESGVRLLFRFPDGSSVNHKFDCGETFHSVREFVANHIRNNMGCQDLFEIKQFFPRRTILTTDDKMTLVDLQLVPSASFAVSFISKPVNSSSISSAVNWSMAPINFICLTIWSIFEWALSKFRRTPSNPPSRIPDVLPNTGTSGSGITSQWEERQRRLLAAESRTIMKDGNVAGFKDSSKNIDDDEDEARWNGNSTQQM